MIRLYIIAADTPHQLAVPFNRNADVPAALEVVPIAKARRWSLREVQRLLDDLETIVAPHHKHKDLFHEQP